MMRVQRLEKERSNVCDLVKAAIKSTYNTRKPGEVERCVEVLNQLKFLCLSVKDILISESIIKLEPLKRHRNPKIRKEAQDLFDSWTLTLHPEGRSDNNGFKACLNRFRLKPRQRSELKKIEDERSVAHEEDEISLTRKEEGVTKKTDFLELRKKDLLTREGQGGIKKKSGFMELINKIEDERSSKTTCEKIKTKTKEDDNKTCEEKDLTKPLNVKRRGYACEAVTKKKARVEASTASGSHKITAKALPPRQNTERQVTTKSLIPPPRRSVGGKNPKFEALETRKQEEKNKKVVEMVELKKIEDVMHDGEEGVTKKMRKKDDQNRSLLTREAQGIKKKTSSSKTKEDDNKACEEKDLKKPLGVKRKGHDACEAVTTRVEACKVAGNHKTTPKVLTQHSRQNTERQFTTKSLIPPPRRNVGGK